MRVVTDRYKDAEIVYHDDDLNRFYYVRKHDVIRRQTSSTPYQSRAAAQAHLHINGYRRIKQTEDEEYLERLGV